MPAALTLVHPLTGFQPSKRAQMPARDAESWACRTCGIEKPAGQFRKGKFRTQCLVCRGEYCAAHYKSQPRKYKARAAKWKTKNPGYHTRKSRAWAQNQRRTNPAHYMWQTLRQRARARGIEFNLEPTDLFIPEFCPVLGVRLSPLGTGNSHFDTAPSVDRIESRLGYVRGNVAVISKRANYWKSNATAEDHERIAAWMRSVGAK